MSKVGFIGLGRMGTQIARNLAESGVELLVYNRTRSKVEDFLGSVSAIAEKKPIGVEAPSDLASCDIVFTMLTDARAVEEVLFSPTSGLLSRHGRSRKIAIADMSTVGPSQSVRIAAMAERNHADFLDAPVSGGPKSAREKLLVVFVGGREEAYERVSDLLSSFSKRSYYVGRNGMGCFMKLITVVNLSSLIVGLSESLALAKKVGIDKGLVVEIINNTASNRSGLSESKGPTMAKEDYAPTFALSLMSKDLNLVRSACEELKLPLSVSRAVGQLYESAVEKGYGDLDFSAIVAYEEELAAARAEG